MLSRILLAGALVSLSSIAAAATFDGKTNLTCTVQQLHECDSFSGCAPLDSVYSAPLKHLDVDFKRGSVQLEDIKAQLSSPIASTQVVEGKLILQGTDSGLKNDTQDGAGWSMSINQRYGTMTLSVAGQDVAFVGFGACVPRR
jgi:hypothetical protein